MFAVLDVIKQCMSVGPIHQLHIGCLSSIRSVVLIVGIVVVNEPFESVFDVLISHAILLRSLGYTYRLGSHRITALHFIYIYISNKFEKAGNCK